MLGQSFDDVLTAARAGAGWACTRLYEDLAGVVTGYLRQHGATEPDDVASETFLQVFRGLDGFEGDETGFRSWVFTIAHRRLLDERRHRSRRPATSELQEGDRAPAATELAEDGAMADASMAAVRERLAVLTEAQRDVVLLRVVAGLTVAETAAAVGRGEAAVRQLQRRALATLAAATQDEAAPRGDEG